jgi:hypothetical protein
VTESVFDVSLRLFETEIIGFALASTSTHYLWLFFGLFAMLAVAHLFRALRPYFDRNRSSI